MLCSFNLTSANLFWADLKWDKLVDANLRWSRGMRASFINAELDGADFGQSTMIEVDLRNANLSGANFQSCNMNGADLGRALMDGANFSLAMIRDSMWIMADMRNANFEGASLHRADLNMAIYDQTTRFPQGFDPQNTGWKDVEE